MYALKRGGIVITGAMTWRPLLGLCVLALLVAVQGCGGDKEVDAVVPAELATQVSPSSAVSQDDAFSLPAAAPPAAQSRAPLLHGSSELLSESPP